MHPESSSGEPSLHVWRRLHDASSKFRQLAPWSWMSSDHLFGVLDPETRETAYCCVSGSVGEVFGLLVYPGDEGLSVYRRMSEKHGPGSRDMRLYMRCISAEFVDRQALDPEDRRVLQALGIKPRRGESWPLFRSYEPLKSPWFLTSCEAALLAVVLEQALEVCLQAQREPSLLVLFDDARIFRRVQAAGSWKGEWGTLSTHEDFIAGVEPVNPLELARLKAEVSGRPAAWEADFGCAPFPVQETKRTRPHYPLILMIVDHQSGFILGFDLVQSREGEKELRRHFLDQVEKHRFLPERLLVTSPSVFAAFEPVAKELKIELKLKKRLPAIEAAYTALGGQLAEEF